MGGAPRIIKKVVSPIKKVVRPPSSPIAERRVEVAKKTDAVEYVRATHKLGDVKKLFKVPQEIYDSEYGKVGATSLRKLSTG